MEPTIKYCGYVARIASTNPRPELDELKYNHTCLFLSIDEEKLGMKKNAYLRYKKVNKSKLAQSVEYLKSKSFDMTNCSLD